MLDLVTSDLPRHAGGQDCKSHTRVTVMPNSETQILGWPESSVKRQHRIASGAKLTPASGKIDWKVAFDTDRPVRYALGPSDLIEGD